MIEMIGDVSIPPKSGLSFSHDGRTTTSDRNKKTFLSRLNPVSVFHLKNQEPTMPPIELVSIPPKSGLSFSRL